MRHVAIFFLGIATAIVVVAIYFGRKIFRR